MVDSLTAIVASIDDDAVTAVKILGPRYLCRCGHKVAKESGVLCEGFGLGAYVHLGYDEQMCGGLRVDVRKRQAELIFINAIGWDGTGDDLAEQAVGRHWQRLVQD